MINLPAITNRQFGVEIEFIGANPRDVAEAINDAGIDTFYEGYHHRTRSYWKIVTDGSLSYNSAGAGEIVSPILKGEQGARQLEKVLNVLEGIEGIRVDRSCGVHIHLDVSDLTVGQVQNVYARYSDFEGQIDMIMPLSRRANNNRWCRSIGYQKGNVTSKRITTKRTLAYAQEGDCAGKYHKVNINKLTEYGTIEFRQHSGTHSFVKVINWLSFLQAFVDTGAALTTSVISRPKKSRAYHTLRTLLENNNFDLTYNSGDRLWKIAGTYFDTNLDTEVLLSKFFTGDELETLYATTKETSLIKSDAERFLRRELFRNSSAHLFDFTKWDFVPAAEANQGITDNGWLTGVDEPVQRYFAERELELN